MQTEELARREKLHFVLGIEVSTQYGKICFVHFSIQKFTTTLIISDWLLWVAFFLCCLAKCALVSGMNVTQHKYSSIIHHVLKVRADLSFNQEQLQF